VGEHLVPTDTHLEGSVEPERLVIIEVFVSESARNDALFDHRSQAVLATRAASWINNQLREAAENSRSLSSRTKQQDPAVARNFTAVKKTLRFDGAYSVETRMKSGYDS
jgi:hypothetical protein